MQLELRMLQKPLNRCLDYDIISYAHRNAETRIRLEDLVVNTHDDMIEKVLQARGSASHDMLLKVYVANL